MRYMWCLPIYYSWVVVFTIKIIFFQTKTISKHFYTNVTHTAIPWKSVFHYNILIFKFTEKGTPNFHVGRT